MQQAEVKSPQAQTSCAHPRPALKKAAWPRGPGGPVTNAGEGFLQAAGRGRRRASPRRHFCKPRGARCRTPAVWGVVSSDPQRRRLPSSLSDLSGPRRVVKAPPASFPPSCGERTQPSIERATLRTPGPGRGGEGRRLPQGRVTRGPFAPLHPLLIGARQDASFGWQLG